jgi:hypothetical protein
MVLSTKSGRDEGLFPVDLMVNPRGSERRQCGANPPLPPLREGRFRGTKSSSRREAERLLGPETARLLIATQA